MTDTTAPLTVTATPDDSRVTMAKDNWSHTIPAAELPLWLALYRRLRDREGGKYSRFYTDDVATPEEAQHELLKRRVTA